MTGTLRVTPEKIMESAGTFATSAKSVKYMTDQMLHIVKSLHAVWQGSPSALYIQKFYALDNDMQQIYRKIMEHSKDLQQMAETYQKAEDHNVSVSSALPTGILAAAPGGDKEQTAKPQADTSNTPGEKPKKGAVLQGAIQGSVGIASGSLSGNLLGYSYDTESGLTVKYKTDEATGKKNFDSLGVKYGAKGEVHAAQGTAEGHLGIVSGSVTGTVGKVSAAGSIGASLYKDGKLTPQISANAEVKGTVLEGSANVAAGSDNNDIHVKASGEVLSAKAEANVNAGKINFTDADGNKKSGVGVQAEVGAEAYVASGKLKGGIKILGVDIDIGLSGHAGGASAKVGGHVTTGGVGGSVDVGLGAGIGLDFSIDWSDFKFGW